MRLVLVFSGFLAAVTAASDAARGSLLSTLTGRVDDAAAADRDDDEFADVAAPAFEGDPWRRPHLVQQRSPKICVAPFRWS